MQVQLLRAWPRPPLVIQAKHRSAKLQGGTLVATIGLVDGVVV